MDVNQDSVVTGLKKVYTDITQLNLAPDAGQHKQFIDGMGNAIIAYINSQYQKTIGNAQQQAMSSAMGAAGAMPGGADALSGMGGSPQQQPAMAGAMAGGMNSGAMSPQMAGNPSPSSAMAGGGMMGLSPSANPRAMDEIQRVLGSKVNV